MDFPCEDASLEYQCRCFIIFPSPSSTPEKCGLKIDTCVKTNAHFTPPDVFLWEKHWRAKEGCLCDLDYKRILVSSGHVAHGKPGDWAKEREAGEWDLFSELRWQRSPQQPNPWFGVLTQCVWTLGMWKPALGPRQRLIKSQMDKGFYFHMQPAIGQELPSAAATTSMGSSPLEKNKRI